MKKLFLSIAAVLTLSLIPIGAYALEYNGIGGVPANPREDNPRSSSIFIYELKPGDSYTDGVKVSNNTEASETIKVGVVDSVASNDGSFACAQEEEDKVDVGSWVKVDSPEVTLNAGESRVVNFTVSVPKTASVGEHGGCITLQKAKSDSANPDGGGVALSFRSAIRISVTIPGDIVKAVNVSGVTLKPNEKDASKFIIQPSVTNTGNVSLDTQIDSKLMSLFGVTISATSSNYPVFPGTTARWNLEVNAPFWGGWYRATVDATYNANAAEGVGESSDAKYETVSGQSSYVFINPQPAALVIEALVFIGFITALALVVRKLSHRRTVKRHWKHHVVAEGESLQKIAKHYKVSWKKLASTNKIRAPYHLEPGDKLKVPPKNTEE